MGRFKYLVDTPAAMEAFRARYRIPQGVVLEYCPPERVLTDREVGQVVIPMIAFIEGRMTLSLKRFLSASEVVVRTPVSFPSSS